MQFNVGFATDIGRRRQQNQDSGLARPELGLFVVADGMGGHKGGETASAIAVETIPGVVERALSGTEWDPRDTISRAIEAANDAIHKRAEQEPQLQGMGTTTVAMLFSPGKLTIGHVGDSRCYYFRPDAIWQVTRDHSLVQEKLRAGLITRAELKTDKMKNVITRSVGFEEKVNVETYEMQVNSGDAFVICSDGLSGMVDDLAMLEIIQQSLFGQHDAKRTVQELVSRANQNGGDDNITAIVVQVV